MNIPSSRKPPRLSDHPRAVGFKDKYPIILEQVPNSETLNPLLADAIKQCGDKQNHSTNVKADMTDFRMWEPNQPAHQQFQVLCRFALELAIANSPPQAREHFKPSISDCWGAVYRKDEYTLQHDHWPAIWSWSYYVSVTSECAPIVFPHANKSIQPRNGMMCMFPGWVAHYVPKQACDHERIMIAGNIIQHFGQ